MSQVIHTFQPGDNARMLYDFEDLSFDGDGEADDYVYTCNFTAGEKVSVVHSEVTAITNDITGHNIPFVAIRGRDRRGMFRTVVLAAENLAPVTLS